MVVRELKAYTYGSGYFVVTSYRNIFTILPSLAVGFTGKAHFSVSTGKARFGISNSLHWARRLGLGMVSTLWPCINIEKCRRLIVGPVA